MSANPLVVFLFSLLGGAGLGNHGQKAPRLTQEGESLELPRKQLYQGRSRLQEIQ